MPMGVCRPYYEARDYFELPGGSVGSKKAGGNRKGREEAVYDVADDVGVTGAQFRGGG